METNTNSSNKIDKFTLFFNDFKFFSIKNSKTPLYVIFNCKTGKIYFKGRIGFIDDLYYIMKEERYMEGYSTIIDIIRISSERKCSDRSLISGYLDENNLIEIIDDTIFKPVEKRIIYEDGGKYLNEYTPTKYLSSNFNNGCSDPNSFPNIKELMMNICAEDEGAYQYLLKILSLSIRKPWIKRHGYIVFQGEGASGKGTFFDFVMKPIFEKYLVVDTEEIFRTNFNGYSFDKLWVFVEEKDDSQNRYKGNISATLKTISGNQTGVSERKGFDRKIVQDYRNFGMTTNKTTNVGLNLEKNDRRATIFGYSNSLGGSPDKAPEYRVKYEKEIPKELDNFVSYLKNMEYDEKEVFNSYKNDAREQLINIDKSNTDLFISDLESYSGSFFNLVIKDYEFLEKNPEFNSFGTNDKKYNLNIFYTDKSNEQEEFILLQTIYELFKKFCENTGKHPVGYNKFSTEFSYLTKLKSCDKTVKGKKKKMINLESFLKVFNLSIDNNTEIISYIEVKSK
jgi:hypothetical protein